MITFQLQITFNYLIVCFQITTYQYHQTQYQRRDNLMQVDYVSILKDVFESQTRSMFGKFMQQRSSRIMESKLWNNNHEMQMSSQTNQTTHIQQQQPNNQQQSIENMFKLLSGAQVLKIYEDSNFFNQLLSNRLQFPHQIGQIMWRITYLLGQLLMQIQSNLIQYGYLQNSMVWDVKQIKQIAYRLLQLQMSGEENKYIKQMKQIKEKMVVLFDRGSLSIYELMRVYNTVVRVWKKPLEININLQKNNINNNNNHSLHTYMHVQPTKSITNMNTYRPIEQTIPSHKTQTINAPSNPISNRMPATTDINAMGDNLLVSQVKPFNPWQKQPTSGKKAIQNKIKRARGRMEAAQRPLHLKNRKTGYKLNSGQVYRKECQRYNQSTTINGQNNQQNLSNDNAKAVMSNKKTVRDIKLDAVKAKMAVLNSQVPTNKATNQTPSQKLINPTPTHKMTDLGRDKIVLSQNRNRIINRQMNGFRPAIITQTNLTVQQNIMKGSFGPNFSNKMMPSSSQKRMGRQQNGLSGMNINKNTNIITSKDRNKQKQVNIGNIQPVNIIIQQANQIIEVDANKSTKNNPTNQNMKLQQKLQQPTLINDKSNDKLNLPQDILINNNIQPITIPVITNHHTPTNNNKSNQNNQPKEYLQRLRQRWGQEQQKILTQTFIQKADQHQSSKLLQQAYGTTHPKHSAAGVRLKIEGIVRKVHQKFCSLNTKNENIRKFKQNWQYIRRSSMGIRRRIYRQIVVIYTAMLNMSEQKRQVISSKLAQINRICQQQTNRIGLAALSTVQVRQKSIDVK